MRVLAETMPKFGKLSAFFPRFLSSFFLFSTGPRRAQLPCYSSAYAKPRAALLEK